MGRTNRTLCLSALLVSVLFLSTACSRSPDTSRPGAPRGESIGNATMLEDRTIVLDLVAVSGETRGHAQFRYPPEHPEYAEVLEHLGGMSPGQQKLVPPWPDDIDDRRVESSVHAWVAREKGWRRSRYRVEITGTDAEDNIAVTVFHRDDERARSPGGGKSVALRLAPDSYEVVRVLRFQ